LRSPPAESHGTIGKYVIQRRIGEGGMGTIFEARHAVLGHRVAIKVITTTTDGVFERFEREARATARLNSPHIATVIDLDTLPDGKPYMVMELLLGNDLAAEIAHHGRLPVDVAAEYVSQALEGIADAHAADIVHRDLKPSNLFLCKSANASVRPLVKLLDFGIVKLTGEGAARLTGTLDSFGTPDYMSPEQIRASRDVDARADLWSLGIVLYEALVGHAPFEGSPTNVIASIVTNEILPPSRRAPGIPPVIDAIVMKALRKNRDERFQTAQQFLEALAPFRPEPLSSSKLFAPPKTTTELVPLLGMLLVELGAITAKQLRQAVAIQEREPIRRLGDILVAMGACTEAHVSAALAKQRDSMPAGAGPPRPPAQPAQAPPRPVASTTIVGLAPAPTPLGFAPVRPPAPPPLPMQPAPPVPPATHPPARRQPEARPLAPVIVAPEPGPSRQMMETIVIPKRSVSRRSARLWIAVGGLMAVGVVGAGFSLVRSASRTRAPVTSPVSSPTTTPAEHPVATQSPTAATSVATEAPSAVPEPSVETTVIAPLSTVAPTPTAPPTMVSAPKPRPTYVAPSSKKPATFHPTEL
jgi:hypothetical protein